MQKDVDVVIISWAKDEELLKVTRDGLDSLFNSDSNINFHVYVVESNHSICYENWYSNIKTIHPNTSFGYHKYLNIGVSQGSSPYVVLCNSDLTYEQNWASEIIKEMEANPKYLSASPWCPQVNGDHTTHQVKIYEGHTVRKEIAGWCIFQQRKIYDIIEKLDERFSFWYCDNDYALELYANNIKHILVVNSIVNHHGEVTGKTVNSLEEIKRKEMTLAQEKVFKNKWSERSFILAQKYKYDGNFLLAEEWFTKRFLARGDSDEVYLSLLEIAIAKEKQKQDAYTVECAYLKASYFNPKRPEAFYHLARFSRINKDLDKCYCYASKAEKLSNFKSELIQEDYSFWRVLDEISISAYYANNFQHGKQACEKLLALNLTKDVMERVKNNYSFYCK